MMSKFVARVLCFSLGLIIPFAILLFAYVYFDPFKVVHSYGQFYDVDTEIRVGLNRDYVSTQTFIQLRDSMSFDSFIFGNSRSIFYQIDEWKRYLDTSNIGFHYDASGESLWAMHKKFKFLDKGGSQLSNALVILDHSTLTQDKKKTGHLSVIHPALIDYSNKIEMHKTFFKAFLSPQFLVSFIELQITGTVGQNVLDKLILDNRPMEYDYHTNEIRFTHFEAMIDSGTYYNPERRAYFYERSLEAITSAPVIQKSQKALLEEIRSIFDKHNTNYKIVVNPLYDQIHLHPEDLSWLYRIFGEEHVFDFSGKNEFTDDFRNYYETSHYRPKVASRILELIYEAN